MPDARRVSAQAAYRQMQAVNPSNNICKVTKISNSKTIIKCSPFLFVKKLIFLKTKKGLLHFIIVSIFEIFVTLQILLQGFTACICL